jgi:phage tail sheath protein FI
LADDGAVAVITLRVEVSDASGLLAGYAALGFHPSHPRYALLLLGETPPSAAEALAAPLMIAPGSGVDAFKLHAALLGGATDRTITISGGNDGASAPGDTAWSEALDRLLALEDISIVAAPGSSAFADPTPAAVNQLLIGHAETRRAYRIAVLDTPPRLEPDEVRRLKSRIDSKYAALYYPWIRMANPVAGVDPLAPRELDLPPSGFVCGIYVRNDMQRGVHKAPANETVTGAIGVQREVLSGEQEVLNPLGINCIRALPNRGIRVWGARTLSSDPEWKHVNVRRYLLYLEGCIDRGTQWAVFEANDERLWANIRSAISDFLYNEWVKGALAGATPTEAFFVRCDRSTMTQNDLENGRLVCLIGVAMLKPAEFVIFRIGQKTADSVG